MADIRRLANLPGYDDTARDIYETPDLTDDTTSTTTFTHHTTSPRSPASETSNTSNEEDYEDADDGAEESDDQSYGVSRRRLYPERARRKFNGVRAGGGRVDLSDRVDGRRRGLMVRSTRGKEEEEEDEGLEARIARLRREIEECKAEAAAQSGEGTNVGDLEGLSGVLKGIEVSGRRDRGEERFEDAVGGVVEDGGNGGGVTDEQILGRVGHLDSRLSALEQALGISALHSATVDAASTPVLPSLLLLDQQLATLSSAGSLMNLETASARIQKLKTEAEQLAQSHSQQATTTNDEDDETQPSTTITPEDMTKLRSLYQLLPTLQSLSPTVPALLTRLRSLRTLHTTAATAAEALEEVEKRQAEMEGELKAWKQGLEKVESAVAGANEANGRNGVVVEGWVKEIEGRMKGLSV